MICKNCSAEYDDSYSFCPECGEKSGEAFVLNITDEEAPFNQETQERELVDISYIPSDDAEIQPEEELVIPHYFMSQSDEEFAQDFSGEDYAEPEEDEENVTPEEPAAEEAECVLEDVEKVEDEAVEEVVQETLNQDAYQEVQKEAFDGQEQAALPQEDFNQENTQGEVYEADPYVAAQTDAIGAEGIKPEVKVRKVARRRKAPVISKKEKKATASIVSIMCVVGALCFVMAYLGIKTDMFKEPEQEKKAVALTGLTAQEEIVLEKELASCFSAVRTNFDCSTSDAESFVSRINPADPGNIYSKLFATTEVLLTEADPAMRFCDEYGDYSYYKIEASRVALILGKFGFGDCDEVNTENCYYYDGYYYFSPVAQKKTPTVFADITKSKKVLDGSYYVEGYFYAQSAEKTVKSDTYYMLVQKQTDTSAENGNFTILKSNIEPLFNDAGNLTEAGGAVNYKIESKVIEGKVSDGNVYCSYSVEYPVFEGNGQWVKSVNKFFADTLAAYELRASTAEKDYISFLTAGGNKDDLPFSENVVTRVTFSDESKVSVVEKIASVKPEIPEAVEEETTDSEDEEYNYEDDFYGEDAVGTETEQQPVKLFTRTVEGYTFDKVTGDFISKDVLIGKDYLAVSEVLYRIYNSYEYEAILPVAQPVTDVTDVNGLPVEETTAAYDEYSDEYYDEYYYDEYGYEEEDDDGIPDDKDGFGTRIYESACALTKDGLTFYFVSDYGYVKEVTIPFAVVEKFVG